MDTKNINKVCLKSLSTNIIQHIKALRTVHMEKRKKGVILAFLPKFRKTKIHELFLTFVPSSVFIIM